MEIKFKAGDYISFNFEDKYRLAFLSEDYKEKIIYHIVVQIEHKAIHRNSNYYHDISNIKKATGKEISHIKACIKANTYVPYKNTTLYKIF